MEVAAVAYEKLTPQAKKRVNALLKKNPYYKTTWKTLTATLSPSDKDMMVFMLAATWPDEIKQDGSYQNDGARDGDVPPKDSTIANANVGYSDTKRHKYWHFIDVPFSPDGTKLTSVPMANAEARIGVCRHVLSSTAKDALKSYDLVWLLHLVGDVHQPLHCTTRVSQTQTNGDNGGNLVALHGDGSQLHTFWDSLPGMPDNQVTEADATFASVTQAAQKLSAPDQTMVDKNAEHDWIAESDALAANTVYAAPVGVGGEVYAGCQLYQQRKKDCSRASGIGGGTVGEYFE